MTLVKYHYPMVECDEATFEAWHRRFGFNLTGPLDRAVIHAWDKLKGRHCIQLHFVGNVDDDIPEDAFVNIRYMLVGTKNVFFKKKNLTPILVCSIEARSIAS